ncbi:MAG: radical SAM protein [Planctomycetes bacterium]|nr:radical SAM protein [Planctomycetota bacterium]
MRSWPTFSDEDILVARGLRNQVDMMRPWAFLVEPERSVLGIVEDVATIFLTNKECPFRCLMCDLWQNTLTEPVAEGAISAQIDFALIQLPPARHVKLYNSANFFDPLSIPVEEYEEIAVRLAGFDSVIVENHPKLATNRVLQFRDLLAAHDVELEVAMGLETIHPDVLPRLTKQMTLGEFDSAVAFLTGEGVRVRSFVLLRPPFLSDQEGVEWAVESVRHAFGVGVLVCSVVPVRPGNGIMEQLERDGWYAPPSLTAMEQALDQCLKIAESGQRVFVDLWDAEKFSSCESCAAARIERLRRMNHSQEGEPSVKCPACLPADLS